MRAALAVAIALAAAAMHAEGLYLFVIPTQAPAGIAASFDGPLAIRAFADDAAELAKRVGAPPPAADGEGIELTLSSYPQIAEVTGHDDARATWVIDFDEPAVAELREQALARFGERPSGDELVQFVHEVVDESHERGFDIASVVATTRSGDCTEHAVLLAALARSFGMRARVAMGLALVLNSDSVQTYGHAWTELRTGERWVVADAALRGGDFRVRYLPFGVLTDEGPGYGLSMASLTRTWVKRVEIRGTGSAH